jgi:GTP1/Obg family GTP-binding protein
MHGISISALHYPGGIAALSEAFRPHLEHKLVREGIEKNKKTFFLIEHIGPKFVADFEEVEDTEERARIMRDAYERVHTLLESLANNK